MGFTSIWHWLVVLVIVLVLFGGKGKIASIMGDLGKGLKFLIKWPILARFGPQN